MFTTLRAKVFAGFLLILLLLLGLGTYAILSFRTLVESTTTSLEQNAESGLANLAMYESLVRLDAAQLRLLAGEREEFRKALEQEPDQFYAALKTAQRTVDEVNPGVRQSVRQTLVEIELAWDAYTRNVQAFSKYFPAQRAAGQKLYDETLVPQFQRLKNLNFQLVEQNYRAFRAAKAST